MNKVDIALQSVLGMDKGEVEKLANKIQFFSPSKAEALEFFLSVANREFAQVDLDSLEIVSDYPVSER